MRHNLLSGTPIPPQEKNDVCLLIKVVGDILINVPNGKVSFLKSDGISGEFKNHADKVCYDLNMYETVDINDACSDFAKQHKGCDILTLHNGDEFIHLAIDLEKYYYEDLEKERIAAIGGEDNPFCYEPPCKDDCIGKIHYLANSITLRNMDIDL